MRRLAPLVYLLLGTACARRLPEGVGSAPRVLELAAGTGRFRIEYQPQDEPAAREVARVLPAAVAVAERWGSLRAPITITLHPTHEALEAAVQHEGHGWLRGWARFDTVEVQSPRTWSAFGAPEQEVKAFLAHELTHCVMYQGAGSASSWAGQAIPLWFREGMASVTAAQDQLGIGPDRLAVFYRDGGGDPLGNPEPLYRTQSELVYGTAHLAFRFLVERYGEERVRGLLGAMHDGEEFAGAFRSAIGIPLVDFEGEFRRYVTWQGWVRPR